MIKRLISIALTLALMISVMPTAFAADAPAEIAHADIGYGTPTIDGEIDEIWSKTNYNVMGLERDSDNDFYRGWFKLMWDETNLYVLAKIYGEEFKNDNESAWENDSLEVFVDEKFNKSTRYEEDDYQNRADFEGNITAANYPAENITAEAKLYDNHYILEMSFPFKTITPKSGTTIGFDVQVNTSATTFFPRRLWGWSESSRRGAQYSNTSIFGTATMLQEVEVKSFNEPTYVPLKADVEYNWPSEAVVNEEVKNVTISFDGNATTGVTIMHSNEKPMIEINQFAKIIGATVKNGDTLVKDKVTIKYNVGSKIANYTHADYPNRADYMTTYYTNVSDVLTSKGSNTLSKIETSLIPGEKVDKSLPANYRNDGTDGENDGYIMERAPIRVGGKLYVPLGSIVPTLNYHVEYWRFNNPAEIEITTGTAYPAESTYKKFYAKDYGAVGDGVTDDRDAILKGFNAAVMCEEPSMFVLEPGKTYKVSEKTDSNAFFTVYKKDNFTFEGNGSTILMERPLNSSLFIRECANVKFRDVIFMYDEHLNTHGTIKEINEEEGWFTMEVAPSGSLIPPTEWSKALKDAYSFGAVYDLENKHIKFLPYDNYNIEAVEHLGGRMLKMFTSVLKTRQKVVEPGDGFVIGGAWSSYDQHKTTKEDNSAGIYLFLSKDLTLDGVVLTGGPVLGISIGLCEGNITLRNYQMRTKDGQLTASRADAVHSWRNRSTLLIEDSQFWNNIDDHINTKGEMAGITAISADRMQVTADYSQNFKVGDEIIIVKRDSKNTPLGTAYIKGVTEQSGRYILDLDRPVSEEVQAVAGTYKLYNNMATNYGTCIRGTLFTGSRRHSYISRSTNVIYMNNYVQNNGGCTVDASDEIGTSEGPFPCAFTIRNNRTYGDGKSEHGHVPGVIAVRQYNSDADSVPSINDVLVEGNIVQVNTGSRVFYFNCVNNLYFRNNTILWNDAWNADLSTDKYKNYQPVFLSKCGVKEFDGLNYNIPVEVDQVVHFAACGVNENNVKNITVKSGNDSAETKFELCK